MGHDRLGGASQIGITGIRMKPAVLVLLIAVLQVLVMYVGYGSSQLGIPMQSLLAIVFVLAPLVAALAEFRLLESSGLRPRHCFAAALGVTLLATYLGVFFAFNSFGT